MTDTNFRYEQHAFIKKICHWQYCVKYGLVALKNDSTQKAIRSGCNWNEILNGRKCKEPSW